MAIPTALNGAVLVYDTETAELGDRVCEIGFTIFQAGEVVMEWGTLINPTVPIDPEASNIHHIMDKDVMNMPTFADIAWLIHSNLSMADVHVAYNYTYDRGVLEKEFARVGMSYPIKPMVDPFIFFKQYNKYHKGKTLIKAAERYGIPYVGAHRAVNDATVTGKVLFRMAATKVDFPKDIKALVKKQRQWVELQYNDFREYCERVKRDLPDQPNYAHYEVEAIK